LACRRLAWDSAVTRLSILFTRLAGSAPENFTVDQVPIGTSSV